MNKKVYVLVEKFTEDNWRTPEIYRTDIHNIYESIEGAKEAAKDRHDEIIEEIIGGDENDLNRISVDDTSMERDEGVLFTIGNDICNEWEMSLECYNLIG